MKKNLFTTLLCLGAMFAVNNRSNAQQLIQYWNFNSFTTTYDYPQTFPIGPIHADYSDINTATAAVWLGTFPGTSATWHSTSAIIMDWYPTVTADYDTANLWQGAIAGNALRPRNQLDSAYLYFYIPTTNFNNITVAWDAESSSTSSGDGEEWFAYSNDSGVTWNTALLSEPYDSAWLTFKKMSVNFTTDAAVNNNPKLVFRINFINHNNGTSGNNRIDNISVTGDSIINPVVIHYWDFNTYATTYTYSPTLVYPLGPIHADYSAINTATTGIWFGTDPGTSSSWHSAVSTVMDPVATVLADYDTVNVLSPPGVTPGVSGAGSIGIRPRNPLDSAYLYFYIPTTGYHNISLTWGAESSSTASGDGEQWFDYSKDSGLTWNTALLSEPYDSAWLVFKRISVNFTSDSGVNNNPKLVFRIHFLHNTSLTSGNNRFDNISVNGIPYIQNNTIATTAASYGPYCNASASNISVAFTDVGTYTGTWSVQLSNSSGSFASGTTTIGTGTSSPIAATIPASTAAGTYRVRVINSAPATNSSNDNGTNIIINGPPPAHNVTGSAAYCSGGTGVVIGLNGSQTGITYKLYLAGTYTSDSVNGTNAAISFGNQTGGGAYTVIADYTATPACNATMTGSAIVTVNPTPNAITGNNTICAGSTEQLSDTLTGGTWSSGFTSAATINSTTGFMTTLAPGLSVITYAMPTGCSVTTNVIINSAVPPLSGTTNVCTGQTTDLSESADGTWSSSNTALATIDPYAGVVGGIAAGTPTMSFTTSIGCVLTTTVTVNQTPPAIGGPASVCVGSEISLTDGVTGGTWMSSDGTATIDPVLGTVSGMSEGTPTITYTLTGGCTATTGIAVNPLPSAISGSPVVCVGSVTELSEPAPGIWTSSDPTLATVDGLGNVSGVAAGNPVIVFTLPTGCQAIAGVTVNPIPSAITGTPQVCATLTTTLYDASTGGSWGVTGDASIDPVLGIVTGISAGTALITYAYSTGCMVNATVVVNQLPGAISGSTNACVGQTNPLSDEPGGGYWSASNGNVTIGVSSGNLSGVSAGTSTITYTLPTGCLATTSVVVNPLSPIVGLTAICSGLTATLTDATTGGTWSSDNMAAVSIDPVLGVFSSLSPGTSDIAYTLSTGCIATSTIAVSLSPAAITGDTLVCTGTTSPLVDPGGGTWSSSNPSVAPIGAASGIVSGITAGSTTITYLLGSGCAAQQIVNISPSPSVVTGVGAVCQGSTTTLHDVTPGGSWGSSPASIATVDPFTGVVTGVAPGNSVITYYSPAGCAATEVVSINSLPSSIRGIANFCAGASSALGDSITGGVWSSSNTLLATINPVTGSISGLSAGSPVIAYSLATGCHATIVATINPLPTVYTVTGGGSYCTGSGGSPVGLSGSAPGVTYQLYHGVTHVGSPIAGTGFSLAFGPQTLEEIYTVIATDGLTGCSNNMAGSAPVVENSLPAMYLVTGGGNFCSGGAGVHIGLDGSNAGISYQLVNTGGGALGFPVTGSSGPVDFGAITTAGSYHVVATNGATGCTNNMIDTAVVTVDPSVTPSVTLSTGVGDVVCSGSLLAITATPVNGGSTPAYSWTLNGVSVSVSGGTYRYLPSDGDNIVAVLTSSAACAVPAMVSSSPLTLSVLTTGAPEVRISAFPSDTVCSGTMVNYSLSSTFGGSAPNFTWVVNGAITSFGSAYTYTPGNGDSIRCVLSSNYQCRTSDSGMSNTIKMAVVADLPPVVTISGAPASVPRGQIVTLTASAANAGPDPYFQWYVDGIPVTGAVYPTFIDDNFANGDSVRCEVISDGVCSGLVGNSSVTIHVSTEGVQQITSAGNDISILPNPNKGLFTVKGSIGTSGDEAVTLMVTDMLGQVIYNSEVMSQNGTINEQVILPGNLANGMYLLTVHSSTQNNVFHFVMER